MCCNLIIKEKLGSDTEAADNQELFMQQITHLQPEACLQLMLHLGDLLLEQLLIGCSLSI